MADEPVKEGREAKPRSFSKDNGISFSPLPQQHPSLCHHILSLSNLNYTSKTTTPHIKKTKNFRKANLKSNSLLQPKPTNLRYQRFLFLFLSAPPPKNPNPNLNPSFFPSFFFVLYLPQDTHSPPFFSFLSFLYLLCHS